jgi:hypothetical protein
MASMNARLIEKDIMTGVAAGVAGDSEIVDLSGANKFSCQLVYTVDTPVGITATFEASNDGVTWTALQAATTISADGSTFLEQPNVAYRYFKVVKALTSGTADIKALVLVIGDAE